MMQDYFIKKNIFNSHSYKSGITEFYPSPKSFWLGAHVNGCQYYTLYINLHILLNILCTASSKLQELSKSIKYIKSYQENRIEFLIIYFYLKYI